MKKDSWVSLIGVVGLALALPLLLQGMNSLQRLLVGAEGRLAAVSVETDHPLGPMPQPWRGLAQGGEELKTFLDNTAGQVAAIKPALIRIDHIYDGFDVVSRGNDLQFNWGELDKMVDKIRSTGATPLLSLSYMPTAISKSDTVDEPRDWNEWSLVVQKTIEHYSGEKSISGVYYEVWNEPDLFGKWTMGGKKDYKNLYLYAARGAARAAGVQSFKLGGPATTGLYKNWMDGFFPFVLQNNLKFDFFSWHRYDLSIDKYNEDAASVDVWLESHPYFSQVEKIVTEMGPDSKSGGVNMTSVGAAHLIAVTRELLGRVKYGLSFSITGGWGIIGTPRYSAMVYLNRLGGMRLAATGEGTYVRAIAAQKDKTYQVLLVDYDPRGAHSEMVPVTFINLGSSTGSAERKYTISQTQMGGRSLVDEVATTEGILQRDVPMTANSVVLLELTPKD